MARQRSALWLLVSLSGCGIVDSTEGHDGRQAHLGTDDTPWADEFIDVLGGVPAAEHRRIMRLERRPGGEIFTEVDQAAVSATANGTGAYFGADDDDSDDNVSVYGKISGREILGYGNKSDPYGEAWDGTPTYDVSNNFEAPKAKTIFVRLPKQHDDSAAVTLLSLVFFTTTLMYMVKSRSDILRKSTWEAMSQALSIFVALTLFYLIKDMTGLLMLEMKEKPPEDYSSKEVDEVKKSFLQRSTSFLDVGMRGGGDPPTDGEVAVAFIRMVFFLLALEVTLWKQRLHATVLACVGLIGAHMVGFMVADAFGTMQETYPWNQSAFMSGVICFLASLYLLVLLHFLRRSRNRFVEHREVAYEHKQEHETPEEHHHREKDLVSFHAWEHQCIHSENEAVAFCMGLLITQVMRYHICGYLPSAHGVQMNPHIEQIQAIKIFGCSFGLLIFFFSALKVGLESKFGDHVPFVILRMLDVGCAICGSVMAWSLLFWQSWAFWFLTEGGGVLGKGNIMVGQLAMAMLWSWGGLATTFTAMWFEDHVLHGRMKAAMDHVLTGVFMVIGLAWEGCFLTAMYDVVDHAFSPKQYAAKAFARVEVGGILCILLIPAWSWHIFPNSVTGIHSLHGHPHAGGNLHGGHGGEHGEGHGDGHGEEHGHEGNLDGGHGGEHGEGHGDGHGEEHGHEGAQAAAH